jgi:hypothetical protein
MLLVNGAPMMALPNPSGRAPLDEAGVSGTAVSGTMPTFLPMDAMPVEPVKGGVSVTEVKVDTKPVPAKPVDATAEVVAKPVVDETPKIEPEKADPKPKTEGKKAEPKAKPKKPVDPYVVPGIKDTSAR